jgi:transglutaminase-like putative cysteine protease
MRYRVRHLTRSRYIDPVSEARHLARLCPRETPTQRVWRHALQVDPAPAWRTSRVDAFGNTVIWMLVQTAHRELHVLSEAEVETRPESPEAPPVPACTWEEARDALALDFTGAHLTALPFLFPSPLAPTSADLAAWALPSFPPGRPLAEAVADLRGRLHREFTFDPAASHVATPVAETLRLRRGVCQDFAHLMISGLRSLGLAARYVSGYLETLPPPGKPKLQGADASHAWVSVYLPGGGWIELDPTNDCPAGERHLTLGWGRDYADVAPLRGVTLGGGEQTLEVSVDVVPMEEPVG